MSQYAGYEIFGKGRTVRVAKYEKIGDKWYLNFMSGQLPSQSTIERDIKLWGIIEAARVCFAVIPARTIGKYDLTQEQAKQIMHKWRFTHNKAGLTHWVSPSKQQTNVLADSTVKS